MTQVREINDIEELRALRPLWNVLLAQTPGANFFQSLDWLAVYWRHFGAGQKLRALVVGSASAPGGILPLVVRQETTRVGKVRVLSYPLQDWGTYYGPIGASPGVVLRLGLEHIHNTKRDWDLLELRWIDPVLDHGLTREALLDSGHAARGGVWADCPRIEFKGDWNSYWASRASHWRTNVRRSEKRLAVHGQVEYLRFRPEPSTGAEADPRWDLYEACEKIAGESWQGASQTGTTLTHDSVRDFLRDAHQAAVSAGAVDINLLKLDGQPIAFNYAYHYQGNVFGLRTGFSQQPEVAGAGSVLQRRMIEDSFARGDQVYELGAGYLSSKRPWQTSVERSLRYCYYPPAAIRPQLLRLKRWVTGWWKEHHGSSTKTAGHSPAR